MELTKRHRKSGMWGTHPLISCGDRAKKRGGLTTHSTSGVSQLALSAPCGAAFWRRSRRNFQSPYRMPATTRPR